MKKGWIKRAFSLTLAATLVLGLAGCKKSSPEEKSNANSALAKQNVYSYTDIPLNLETDDVSVRDMIYSNGKVYVALETYSWNEETGVSNNTTQIVSCNADGSELQTVTLEPSAQEEGTNSWIGQMVFNQDGSVIAVSESYFEDYTDPDNPIYENKSYLVCWNADGTKKWTQSLDDIKGEAEYIYINNILIDADGNINLMVGGEKSELVSLDLDGNILNRKVLDSNAFENIGNIYVKSDNTLLLLSYNDEWTKVFVSSFDPKTDVLGEKQELSIDINMYNVMKGTTTDFILLDSNGVYVYNIGDENVTPVMNYINSDLASANVQKVAMVDEESFIGVYNDINYKTKMAVFTKVNPEDIPDKQVLVLGAIYLGNDVRQRVVDFNKTNEKYRITLRDYSKYNTMDDYNASYTQLNNDIISGKMPDILIADNQMPINSYIGKGLIADIGKLIEKDEELSKKEFMENVFKAFSIDDKLYQVIPSFYVSTIIGKTSNIGERSGWNMKEMLETLDKMPEGTKAFSEISRNTFLYYVIQYSGSDFINSTTGKCNFDSEEFIDMLEFAKSLPEQIDYEVYEESNYWELQESQYRDNRVLLMSTGIYQIRDMNYTINGTFGEDVTFVGFPNENRNGSVMDVFTMYILSAKSKNLDGAWEFIRYYLTDEYQENLQWELPVNKEIFLKKAQEALERPYYIDQDGQRVSYDDTYYLNGESITLPPMSQQQVDKIVDFIGSVNRSSYYNSDIMKIIEEETEAFFSDQKTAQDVVKIIQSRAQVYVNENR